MQTDTSEMRGWLPGDSRWGGCSRETGVRCSLNDVWLELRSVRRVQTRLTTGWGQGGCAIPVSLRCVCACVHRPAWMCECVKRRKTVNMQMHFQGSVLLYRVVHCYTRMNNLPWESQKERYFPRDLALKSLFTVMLSFRFLTYTVEVCNATNLPSLLYNNLVWGEGKRLGKISLN